LASIKINGFVFDFRFVAGEKIFAEKRVVDGYFRFRVGRERFFRLRRLTNSRLCADCDLRRENSIKALRRFGVFYQFVEARFVVQISFRIFRDFLISEFGFFKNGF
jgi:hypothetical protein